MADFQTCYFCGAGPSDAIEEVGVVPSAFDPTDDQQRSVALCPDCRDKLTAIMEAVVEAGGTDVTSTPDETTRSHSRSEPAATGEDESDVRESVGGGEPAAGAADATEPTGTAEGADATDAGEDRETDTGTGGNRETDAGTGEDRETGPDTLADAVADERDVEAGPEDRAADEESTADAGDDEDEPGIARNEGTGVSFSTATAGDEGAEGDDGGDGDDETPPQRPTGAASVGQGGDDDVMDSGSEAYRQVIRLLQNREFPVQRDEIEAVAASAYELSPAETTSAIDAIVQKGLLVEEDGVLRRDRSQ